ncbi:N/A [soil metagenome]
MMAGQTTYRITLIAVVTLLLSVGLFLPLLALSADNNQQVLEQLNQIRQQQQQQQAAVTAQGLAPAGGQQQGLPTANGAARANQFNVDLQPGVNPAASPPMGLPSPAIARPPRPNPNFRVPFSSQQIPLTLEEQATQEQAFAGAARNLLPMSPEQIHRLRQLYSASQFAAAQPAGTPAKPTSTSLFVNLAPGASPPAIRLSEGFVSALVFLDATGAPWPIEAYDIGNPAAFNIQWNKTDNTLMVQASSLYTYGNLAVRLRGLGTPVMLTLLPGQQEVDYRVDIRIPENGPNATAATINNGLPPTEGSALLGVLNGVPPAGSKLLRIPGAAGQVWAMGEKLYLRTRLTLLSPGWLATMSSADGTKAYELQRTPMILVAEDGKAVQLKIEGL